MDPGRLVPISLAVDLNTENTGTITDRGSFIKNGHVNAYLDKRTYVQQRPAILLETDASETVADTQGRGIYYWSTTNALYFINNDTLYKNSYTNIIGTISGGRDKVHFNSLNNVLTIIDPENGEGWTVNSGDTLAQITDPDFPTSLTGGSAVVDGYLFVMDTTGVIYQSKLDDPTNWNALNFVEAEREPDSGVFISKHLGHVVAFGSRTIEFFYNAANPTGSVLSRRNDIFYSIGSVGPNTFFKTDDQIYFLHVNETGNLGLSVIAGMEWRPLSSTFVDSILTNERVNMDRQWVLSGQKINGKLFIFCTCCIKETSTYTPTYTLVYDVAAQLWYIWDFVLLDHSGSFPVMDTSVRTTSSPRYGQGILLNGDLYRPRYKEVPVDTTNDSDGGYFVEGYIDPSYIGDLGDYEDHNIELQIRPYPIDAGGRYFKFMRTLELQGNFDLGDTDDPLIIGISDDYYNSFFSYPIYRTQRRKLSRLGRFTRRVLEVSYSGPTTLHLEQLEAQIDHGEY